MAIDRSMIQRIAAQSGVVGDIDALMPFARAIEAAARAEQREEDAQFLRDVIALCSHRGPCPSSIEEFDPEDKWIADLWRTAQAKQERLHSDAILAGGGK